MQDEHGFELFAAGAGPELCELLGQILHEAAVAEMFEEDLIGEIDLFVDLCGT
jgi:hypothetical protein